MLSHYTIVNNNYIIVNNIFKNFDLIEQFTHSIKLYNTLDIIRYTVFHFF